MAVDDSKWYMRARGKVLGPFSWPQLEAMRTRGQISKFHELSQDRRNWIPAGDLADLFAANAPGHGHSQGPAVAVQEDSYGVSAAPSPPQGADADPPVWHHARGGASAGPFRLQDLRSLAARGEIDGTTVVWREGMAGWLPCRNVPELAPLFASVQTLPTATAGQSFAPIGPPRTSGLAIASLVLGILWIGGLGSLLAVIFGSVSLSQISKSRGALEGKGMAITGLVLGIIGLAFISLIWLGAFAEVARQEELKRIRGF